MNEIIYQALNSYYNALSVKGYMPKADANKLLVLTFYKDFIFNDYSGMLSATDYCQIECALNCLYGTTCLIPYPNYIQMGKIINRKDFSILIDEHNKNTTAHPYILSQLTRIEDKIPTNAVSTAVSTTYANLVSLRKYSKLLPGQTYRITDYVATINSELENVHSANHPFDIIVTATSTNTLSEDAKAIQHSGNYYFSSCKLDSWELKYSLDNNNYIHSWADSDNGKGVIYWMKDEFGNEAPYDFKGILFACTLNDTGHYDANGDSYQVYTFNWFDSFGSCYDMTVKAANDARSAEGEEPVNPCKCFGNKIRAYYNTSNILQAYCALPQIILLNAYGYSLGICSNNVFGQNCRNIIVGHQAKNNSFGEDCQANVLGDYSRGNIFGNYCCYINLGTGCYYNNIGSGSWNINIANYTRQANIDSAALYVNIAGATTPTSSSYIKNIEVLGGNYGTSSSYGTLSFECNKAYPQVGYIDKDGNSVVKPFSQVGIENFGTSDNL